METSNNWLWKSGKSADSRFSRWFTFVYPEERGWSSSKCLNKDIPAIIKACQQTGYNPHFLKAIMKSNKKHRKL